MADWYQRNRERQAAYNKARYDANIEAERAAGRERSRLRYLKNPQEFKDKFHRRRVRLLGNGPIEKVDFAMVCEEAGWRCHVCGLVVDPAVRWPDSFSASRDHLIPVSQGGPHTYENLALAHLRCNIRRYRTITVA
jgi:5-methylcytosine-specific restriction endonuclease McrA